VIGTLLDGGDAVPTASALGRPLPEPCAIVALPGRDADQRSFAAAPSAPPSEAALDALADVRDVVYAAIWERSVLVVVAAMPLAPVGVAVRSVRRTAERAAQACESAYGCSFVAGLASSETAGGAAEAAREAVDIAVVLARSANPRGRVAFAEEIALDLLLGSPAGVSPVGGLPAGGIQGRLIRRVADVASRPELWETLREFYAADLERGRTARRLGGDFGAFSTQSDKSLNTGEGGFLLTDDPAGYARAVVYSGAYEGQLGRHFPDGVPDVDELAFPIFGVRMDEIRAALAGSVLDRLPKRLVAHQRNHDYVTRELAGERRIALRRLRRRPSSVA
jgi:hypothetical protein